MRKILIAGIFLVSCKGAPKSFVECQSDVGISCLIYPEHGMSIQIPWEWDVIDSTRYWDKSLRYSKSIFSKDSLGEISYSVSELGNGSGEMSSSGMEIGIKQEVNAISKGNDSTIYVRKRQMKNWKIVTQLSYLKGTRYKFFADIYCVNQNKVVSIWVKNSAISFNEGLQLMDCILNSLNIKR